MMLNLISSGADPYISNSSGETAFDELKKRNPKIYWRHIEELEKTAEEESMRRRLIPEDTKKGSNTGYEFDI